jgi:hypothetical protein
MATVYGAALPGGRAGAAHEKALSGWDAERGNVLPNDFDGLAEIRGISCRDVASLSCCVRRGQGCRTRLPQFARTDERDTLTGTG